MSSVADNRRLQQRVLARTVPPWIAAKGMYRDAVRSSRSKVVTCLGLQWICMALLVKGTAGSIMKRQPLALPGGDIPQGVPDLRQRAQVVMGLHQGLAACRT